jgi:2'-hydroxyisoflavone reductase
MKTLLDACRTAAMSDVAFVWVADDELIAADVKPWTELPLWIPEADAQFGGMMSADNSRAVAAGLTFRPIVDTARATLEWDRAYGAAVPPSPIRVTPLTREREAALLAER